MLLKINKQEQGQLCNNKMGPSISEGSEPTTGPTPKRKIKARVKKIRKKKGSI